MKNKFCKILSFIMTAILAASALGLVGISALEEDIDSHLVIHYDFEGADILESLKDKATGGKYEDNLAPLAGPLNFSGLEVDNVNGTVKNTSNSSGLFCPPSQDTMKTSEGSATWLLRFKLDDKAEGNNYFFVVEMRTFGAKSVRPFAVQYAKDKQKLAVAISTEEEKGKARNYWPAETYTYSSDKYINMAVTVFKQDGKYKTGLYLADEFPKAAEDWKNIGEFEIGTSIAQVTEVNKLSIMSNGSNGCCASVTFDDLKLYDTVLTPAQMSGVFQSGSFDGHLKNNPQESETEAEAETEEPAATTVAETTVESTTAAVTDKAPETTAEEAKKGCGSAIGMSALGITGILAGYAVRKKKKH